MAGARPQDISEEEAMALLARPLHCIDAADWLPVVGRLSTKQIYVGVLNAAGARTGLRVRLLYTNLKKGEEIKYLFSVYFQQPYRLERVYQLHLAHSRGRKQDAHQGPHEHRGDHRISGNPAWSEWEYDDALAHFCGRTHIEFYPSPLHPDAPGSKG